MNFLFYAIIFLLLAVCPISLGADGGFRIEDKICFVKVRLFGVKLASIKLLISEEGLYLSINGKKGRKIEKKRERKDRKRRMPDLFSALYFRKIDISLRAGGDPTSVSLALGATEGVLQGFLAYLKGIGHLDDAKVRVLPCYTGEVGTVNFSIRLFFSFASILSSLAHTTKGEKDAKRNDRKFDG